MKQDFAVEVIAKSPNGDLVTLHRLGGGAREDLGDHYYPTRLWFRKDRVRVKTALYFFPDECGYTFDHVVVTWTGEDSLKTADCWPVIQQSSEDDFIPGACLTEGGLLFAPIDF